MKLYNFFYGTFIFFIANIFIEYGKNFTLIRISILLLFSYTLLIAYKEKENNIILLFLISLFTFQYGRVVLLPLINKLPLKITWFLNYKISDETSIVMLKILVYNLYGILIGLCLKLKKSKKNMDENKIEQKRILFILNILLIITILPFFYDNIYQITQIRKIGYAASYVKEIERPKNILVVLLSSLFYTGLFLSLVLYKYRKKWQNFSLLLMYLISSFLISLKGARGIFIEQVFFSIWYISNIIKYRINIKIYISLFFILILFSQIAGSIRSKNEVDSPIFFKIEKFIEEQGITGVFLSQINDNPKLFTKETRDLPYILYPLFGKKIHKQDEVGLELALKNKRVNLDKKMSSQLNSEIFLKGGGIGGNYILEMYDFGGKIGVLILSMLHIVFYRKISLNIDKTKLVIRIIFLILISRLFLVPRQYFINFDYKLTIKVLILYSILFVISNILKRRYDNEHKSFGNNTSL